MEVQNAGLYNIEKKDPFETRKKENSNFAILQYKMQIVKMLKSLFSVEKTKLTTHSWTRA